MGAIVGVNIKNLFPEPFLVAIEIAVLLFALKKCYLRYRKQCAEENKQLGQAQPLVNNHSQQVIPQPINNHINNDNNNNHGDLGDRIEKLNLQFSESKNMSKESNSSVGDGDKIYL